MTLKPIFLSALLVPLLLLGSLGQVTASELDENSGASGMIINRYLQATQGQQAALKGASMEVDIDASVPRLQEHGRLRALRIISKVGRTSYRVLGFQGSNTVKSQVISRYLQAEQQGQGDAKMAITPTNYHFKMKGVRNLGGNKDVYVFALSPRTRGMGLFKGEMWLDAQTCLPVYERGRLVKNPSIFFKKVDFERAFSLQNGAAIPAHMNSIISTRLVGKVELDVNYSHYGEDANLRDEAVGSSFPATTAGN